MDGKFLDRFIVFIEEMITGLTPFKNDKQWSLLKSDWLIRLAFILPVISLYLVSTNTAYSKDEFFEGYAIPNFGSISIPDNMELQGGEYLKFSNQYKKYISEKINLDVMGVNNFVFQPQGINNFEKSPVSLYSRVIIETEMGEYGQYQNLDDEYIVTANELSQFSNEVYFDLTDVLSKIGIRVIQWYGVKPVKINNQNAIKISYLRQLSNNPYVMVNMYKFQNNDRIHTVTLSYRQTEEALWKPRLEKVLQSISINEK